MNVCGWTRGQRIWKASNTVGPRVGVSYRASPDHVEEDHLVWYEWPRSVSPE